MNASTRLSLTMVMDLPLFQEITQLGSMVKFAFFQAASQMSNLVEHLRQEIKEIHRTVIPLSQAYT
jgi:hypothetical protein